MIKLYALLIIFYLPIALTQDDTEVRRNQLLRVIDEEINEAGRLSKQLGHRNPKVLLKIAELYLEKARLIKEVENRRYLSVDIKERSKVKKSNYFKQSTSYFIKAQKTCQGIIKRFKKFNGIEEVYYILAFNFKEFGKQKSAKRYLQLALKNSKKGSSVYKRSMLALAETYYNERNYKRAVPLYSDVLRNKENKWWTKDAYNYAWSLYRSNRTNDAIRVMDDILRTSKNSDFIDMSFQAEKDLGLFYVESGQISKGIEFYQNQGKSGSENIIGIAKLLMDRGKATSAEKVLLESKQYISEKDMVDYHMTLLSLYEKFRNYSKHLEQSKVLFKLNQEGKLQEAQREVLVYNMEKIGGTLQKQVLANTYKKTPKTRRLKAAQSTQYFEMLSQLKKGGDLKFQYLQAETFYAAGDFQKAIGFYDRSYEIASAQKNVQVMKGSLEAMLTILGSKKASKSMQEQYLVKSYNRYLSIDRSSNRAEVIYQKLFTIYYDNKDFENAEKVLMSYKNSFPRSISKHEAALAKLVDHYRKQKDKAQVNRFAELVKTGAFRVNPKYASQLNKIVQAMVFEGVEKASSVGDKKQALIGYLNIFNDPESVPLAKANAAHNIAVLYFELGYASEMSKWSDNAINLMPLKELIRFSGSYLAIVGELFARRNLKGARELAYKMYAKLCTVRNKDKDILYKNAYVIGLADDQVLWSKQVVDSGPKCKINSKTVDEGRIEVLKYLGETKKWGTYEKYIKELSRDKNIIPHLLFHYEKLKTAYQATGNIRQAEMVDGIILRLYAQTKNSKYPVQSLHVVARIRLQELEALVKKFYAIELRFPENVFNQLLTQKIQMLNNITALRDQIIAIKSGLGIVRADQILVEAYQRLVSEVKNFTPPGKEASYIAGFKKSMAQIENGLLAKSREYLNAARNLINSGKVLSPHNYWFLSNTRLPVDVRYFYRDNGIIMDRGGRR